MDAKTKKLIEKANAASSSVEKYALKYNAKGINKIPSESGVSSISRYTSKLYTKTSENLNDMVKHSINITSSVSKQAIKMTSVLATQTLQATKDSLNQMTSELSQDFSLNTKNILAASMSKSMPVFGYAISRAFNTEIVKKMASFGMEKSKEAAVGLGHYIKEKAIEGKQRFSNYREKAKKEKEHKDLVKKVEGIVPKLASGGYLKKDALIKAHKGEIVAPVDKLIKPLERIASDIHALVKNFKSYLEVKTLTDQKQYMGKSITSDDLPKNAPMSLRNSLADKFKPSVLKSFLSVFLRKQLTSMQSYVKSASEGKDTSMTKAFLIAYRTANEDYQAPWQERMLRATLEMRNTLVDNKTRWKLIHESMIAQSATYTVLVSAIKTLKWSIKAPFRAAYTFFKRRGGYPAKLPRNKPAQEATALILGSLYVDSMIKYDVMIKNLATIIKVLSGGKEHGEYNVVPKSWSPATIVHGAASKIKKRFTGSELRTSGVMSDIANMGIFQTAKKRFLEAGRRKEEEKSYISKGPKSSMTLLDASLEQLNVLKQFKQAFLDRFMGGGRGKYQTSLEVHGDEESRQRAMTPLQRARELVKEKYRQKLGIRGYEEKTERLERRNARYEGLRGADKRQLKDEVRAERDRTRRKSARKSSNRNIGMKLFKPVGKLLNQNDPIVVFNDIRRFTRKTWGETYKANKGRKSLWEKIKGILMFGWTMLKGFVNKMFTSVTGLIQMGITAGLMRLGGGAAAQGGAAALSLGKKRLLGGGLLGAGLIMGGMDAYGGVKKAKKWKTSKTGAAIGGILGGASNGGIGSAVHGATKGALIGAGIGSIVPGFGTALGGAIGGIAGGFLGLLGGKNIAKFMDFVGGGIKKLVHGAYRAITWPIRMAWKVVKKVGGLFFSLAAKVTKWLGPKAIIWVNKKIWSIVKYPFTAIFHLLGKGLSRVKEWITSKLAKIPFVGRFFKEKKSTAGAVSAIKPPDKEIKEKTKTASSNWKEILKGKASEYGKKTKEKLSPATGALFSFLKDHGVDVEKLKNKPADIATLMGTLKKKGIDVDKIKRKSKAVSGAFIGGGTEKKLEDWGKAAKKKLEDYNIIKKKSMTIKEKITAMFHAVESFFTNIWDALTKAKEWLYGKLSKIPIIGKLFKNKTEEKSKWSDWGKVYKQKQQQQTQKLEDWGKAAVRKKDEIVKKVKKLNPNFGWGNDFLNKSKEAGAKTKNYIKENVGGKAKKIQQAYHEIKKSSNYQIILGIPFSEEMVEDYTNIKKKNPKFSTREIMKEVFKKHPGYEEKWKKFDKERKERMWKNRGKYKKEHARIYNSSSDLSRAMQRYDYITDYGGAKAFIEKNAKAAITPAKNEFDSKKELIKNDIASTVASSKLTAQKLADATSNSLKKLTNDTKDNMTSLTKNVINQISNVSNSISNNSSNTSPPQNNNAMDPYLNALLTGDIS